MWYACSTYSPQRVFRVINQPTLRMAYVRLALQMFGVKVPQ